MSQLDDGDADVGAVPEDGVDAASDEMIEEVFSHLGKSVRDEVGWDTDDGS